MRASSPISFLFSILSLHLSSIVSLYTTTGVSKPEISGTVTTKPIFEVKSNLSKGGFLLKTHVHYGQSQTKNGLYVSTYHIGAGDSAAVLVNNKTEASKAFFNGTILQFDIGTPFPWGLVFRFAEPYTSWGEVGISVGRWDSNLFLVGNNLVWKDEQFKGWIVCDWSLEEPQLFWKNNLFRQSLPGSCASVDLVAIKVTG